MDDILKKYQLLHFGYYPGKKSCIQFKNETEIVTSVKEILLGEWNFNNMKTKALGGGNKA